MGLDAIVHCDCFERGSLKTQPDPAWGVYVEEDGSRCSHAEELEMQLAFDRWDGCEACEHEDGVLLHHRIGNISTVGFLREALSARASDFPLILEKVIYSGSHCGDFISPREVASMRPELEKLADVRLDAPGDDAIIRTFDRQLHELAECSLRIAKPIVF